MKSPFERGAAQIVLHAEFPFRIVFRCATAYGWWRSTANTARFGLTKDYRRALPLRRCHSIRCQRHVSSSWLPAYAAGRMYSAHARLPDQRHLPSGIFTRGKPGDFPVGRSDRSNHAPPSKATCPRRGSHRRATLRSTPHIFRTSLGRTRRDRASISPPSYQDIATGTAPQHLDSEVKAQGVQQILWLSRGLHGARG